MFNICRLASRKLPLQPAYFKTPNFLTLARHIIIKPLKYEKPPKETHDQYNMRIGRPQSPHLTIYAVELPSTLSITHRMTGAVSAGYVVLLSFTTMILPQPFCYYLDMLVNLLNTIDLGDMQALPIYVGRFILAFPFCYHMCNGVRHLIWDLGFLSGFFLSMRGVYLTGYLMLISAFSLTGALAVLY